MKIRKAKANDLNTIYLMGFDAWSGGDALEKYLQGCIGSPKYQMGSWYVLEKGGDIMASLIVYTNALKLPHDSLGIGSVATVNKQRNKGYASLLVEQVCQLYKTSGFEFAYLFSEIGSGFYQRLGFLELHDTCMVKPLGVNRKFSVAIPDGF